MVTQNMTTFYLVRHGETDWNKQRIIQGQMDIPLNATGEQQAKEAAKNFKQITFDLAFSSDLLRARRTTEIIALEHKLAVETTEVLRERHFGELQEKPSATLQTYFKLMQEMADETRKSHVFAPGVESDEQVISRILTFLRETAITYPGKTILVGTHGGILRLLLVHLGYYTYADADHSRVKNTAHLILKTDGVEFFVKEMVGLQKREDTIEEA
jgi:2,3-bisphosphoglycerate-dependent phosphoglycerate mutase